MSTARAELRELVALAIPLAGTQLASVALPWTDALVMARLGDDELAGGGLGATILGTATIVVGCLFGGLSATLARARAAGHAGDVRAQLAQARLLAITVGLVLATLTAIAHPALVALGQPAGAAREAARYLVGAAPALVAMPLAAAQRHAFAALGRPRVVTLAWACAVPVNAALDVVLAFGAGLGVLGVALATSVVSTGLVLALELALARGERRLTGAWTVRPDRAVLGSILGLGAPIAVAVAVEVGVFAGAALVVGTFGTAALAAHQVALQVTQLLFVAPNGLAQAAAVRVAAARGARDPHRVRGALQWALAVACVWAVLAASAVVLAREPIVLGYLARADETARATARSLLFIVAAFQIVDAIQVVAAGALRGMERTRIAMRWGVVAYGLVAPACAAILVALGMGGATAVWSGLAAGLCVAAIALASTAVAHAGCAVK